MPTKRYPKILITEKIQGRSCISDGDLEGFSIVRNHDPNEVFSLVSSHRPDLIILDAEMPGTNGYELLKTLKSFYKTERIPVMLVAEVFEKMEPCLALELGAIDFIIKPISEHLMVAKINNYIKIYHSIIELEEQATKAKEMNPNTGLPGNVAISRNVLEALKTGIDQVLVYCDLDNFKSYNDKYGFGKGDDIIKLTGEIINEAIALSDGPTFLGHVGGDDFVFMAPRTDIRRIADYIIYNFDDRVRGHYTHEDVKRGYIVSTDRQNNVMKFPIMTLSLAGVTLSEHNPETRYEYIADICAEVKKYAKNFNNSCFYIDRRHKSEEAIKDLSFSLAI